MPDMSMLLDLPMEVKQHAHVRGCPYQLQVSIKPLEFTMYNIGSYAL